MTAIWQGDHGYIDIEPIRASAADQSVEESHQGSVSAVQHQQSADRHDDRESAGIGDPRSAALPSGAQLERQQHQDSRGYRASKFGDTECQQ